MVNKRDDGRTYVANDLRGHGAECQPVYQENVCRIQLGEKRSRSRKVIRAWLRIAPRELQVLDANSEARQARKNFSIVGVAARWRVQIAGYCEGDINHLRGPRTTHAPDRSREG